MGYWQIMFVIIVKIILNWGSEKFLGVVASAGVVVTMLQKSSVQHRIVVIVWLINLIEFYGHTAFINISFLYNGSL